MSYRHLSLALVLLAPACVFRWDDNPDPHAWDDDDASTVSSGGYGGYGAGGSDAGGEGGAGGQGEGGGEPVCNDGVGHATTAARCDELWFAPGHVGLCDDGYAAMGYDACLMVYEMWNAGHAEELADCLDATTDPYDMCAPEPLGDCVAEVYANACESEYIADNCGYWNDLCVESEDVLDVSQCTADLQPFSDDGLYELSDCMNGIEGTCQERYDLCFEGMTTLE